MRAWLAVALMASLSSSGSSIAQEKLTKEKIIQSLQASEKAPLDVQELRDRTLNQIKVEPVTGRSSAEGVGDELARLPSFETEIYFAYDSDVIEERSKHALRAIGEALEDARLAGDRVLIAGHTDSAGSRDYNFRLSEARANAVKRFLVAEFPISPSRLETIGFGEERLRYPDEPEAAANRRVQILNLGPQ